MPAVLDNYDAVLKRINVACLRAGRSPADIRLLPVTKYARAEDIFTLLTNRDIFAAAESRLQDSLAKWNQPPLNALKVKKIFIGQLQSNKTQKVLENFDVIASLSSLDIAKRLDTQAAKLGKKANCLVQIKLTDRQTQSGADIQNAAALIKAARKDCANINLQGLMAIAPIVEDAEQLRPVFKEVKKFFDDNFAQGAYLSLGMSGDFEVAVEEGSNLPRVGGLIFNTENTDDN